MFAEVPGQTDTQTSNKSPGQSIVGSPVLISGVFAISSSLSLVISSKTSSDGSGGRSYIGSDSVPESISSGMVGAVDVSSYSVVDGDPVVSAESALTSS